MISVEASERLDAMQDEELDTAKIEERLDQIRHLMQKYRCDEEGLLELTEKKSRSLKNTVISRKRRRGHKNYVKMHLLS